MSSGCQFSKSEQNFRGSVSGTMIGDIPGGLASQGRKQGSRVSAPHALQEGSAMAGLLTPTLISPSRGVFRPVGERVGVAEFQGAQAAPSDSCQRPLRGCESAHDAGGRGPHRMVRPSRRCVRLNGDRSDFFWCLATRELGGACPARFAASRSLGADPSNGSAPRPADLVARPSRTPERGSGRGTRCLRRESPSARLRIASSRRLPLGRIDRVGDGV